MTESDHFAQLLIGRIQQELAGKNRPIIVALDGRSGAGKSTIAAIVARKLGPDTLTVIEGDQFYGGGSSATWDKRSVTEKVDGVIDWRRQRELLISLKASGTAEWQPFDWGSDDWDADEIPLSSKKIRCAATPVILLEGAYGTRPELADLLDVRVLLHVPTDIRRAQLLAREGSDYRDDWEARWSAAEVHYFGTVAPADGFDLVLGTYTLD